MRILVTGGCGFIGSNFIRHILNKYPDYKIINLDKLTYAGNLENLSDIENNSNYSFIQGDICNTEVVNNILQQKVDATLNFAAESHVDRSIYEPSNFVETNISGTQVLLESALKKGNVSLFIQISTDEVYGSLGPSGFFTEESNLSPNSPYSASKASADLLCRAYFKTFKLPVIITRCSNNYGPYQFPEKLIPLFITNALADQPLPVYGDGLYIRDWIYVLDHCLALDIVLHKGKVGEIYNIGGSCEKPNLEITHLILEKLNKPESLIKHVPDRPGHDRRYAIDSTKIKEKLGFSPQTDFEKGIKQTIDWYIKNKSWWERIKSGEYLKYYKMHYKI